MAVIFSAARLASPLHDAAQRAEPGHEPARYRSLGSHLRESVSLSDAQIEEILLCQRRHGLRFGEAAVRLQLVTREQLQQALARQFEFPVPTEGPTRLAPELVMAHHPFSEAAERLRALRSQLMAEDAAPDAPRRALAVLSTGHGDGKSVLAANLAVSFSQLGQRTLLVDANLRRPRQHELFGIERPVGLGSLLCGRPGAALYSVEGLPRLSLLPAGGLPPNPLELIERPAFTLMLQDWLEHFDQVIVDTPAAAAGADARVLASKCGAALLVARPGRNALEPLQKFVAALRNGPTLLRGMVFNEG
jgi:protein-tyrosine kinase